MQLIQWFSTIFDVYNNVLDIIVSKLIFNNISNEYEFVV